MSKTPLLDTIKTPADLRRLTEAELPQVAAELRAETIDAVSVTGGHLGAGLGVIELTVALHYVFDTPDDRLVWDVGHQTYPHKILTGRRDRIRTLRQGGGLSGFTRRAESEYDPFGAAHSSTSISAGLGMAVARDLEGRHEQRRLRDRRRRHERRHGLRGDEQRGRPRRAPDRRAQRQRHVDRPADGGVLGVPCARHVERHLPAPARHRQAARQAPAEELGAARGPRRGIYAPPLAGRHVVRGARLLLRRTHRRPRLESPAARAQECPRRAPGADPRPRRHQEGQGLRACRSLRRQVSRRRQVQRRHRRAGEAQGQCADAIRACSPTA